MKKSKSKPKTKSKPHTVPAKVHAVPKTKTRNGTIQTIREVFGYLRRYRDQVFVIKIDDSLMDLPLFPLLLPLKLALLGAPFAFASPVDLP